MYPSLKERMELALKIGVTEYEIKIWFKNQRAKYKKKNLSKTHEVLPESNGSSKGVSASTYTHSYLSLPALANIESRSLDTSTVDFILPPTHSLQASLHDDLAIEDTGYSPLEDLLEGEAPFVAQNPGQPTVVESQLYPGVAEWADSMEAPVSTTEGVHEPNNVQYWYPTFEQH
ncbi:Homeobox protein Dlx2a [Lemmus lemmus]